MTIIPALAILKAGEHGALAGLIKAVKEPCRTALSLLYDTIHGASLSIAFPAWMRHMKPKIGHRLEKLGQDLFGDASAGRTIEGLESFFREVQCPVRLGDIGISPDQKDEIVSLMIKNKVNGKNPDNLLNDVDRELIVDLMFAE